MDIVSKINGNTLSATEFNQIPTELEAGITASGQTPSDATLNQVPIFVSRFAANNFYIDSGSADAYVLTLSASMTNPVSATAGYFEGMTIRFRAGNTNTGASTVNVNSAGIKNLKKEDGTTDLTAGDIPTDRDVEFRYDGTSFVLVLTSATTSNKGVSFLPKQITIANGTDADHDLNFTAFNAQADDGSLVFSVGALTKQIDAAWVAGTNQGGLDTGAVANNTPYYIFAIYNPTTLVSDILYSASRTSPTLPSGFTKKEYKGACHTDGSANIRQGSWTYDTKGASYKFLYKTEITDVSATLTWSAQTGTLTAPAFSEVIVSHKHTSQSATSSEQSCSYTNLVDSITNLVSSVRSISATSNMNRQRLTIKVDASKQFQYQGASANAGNVLIITQGWQEYL